MTIMGLTPSKRPWEKISNMFFGMGCTLQDGRED
jgi:hypothetical protein